MKDGVSVRKRRREGEETGKTPHDLYGLEISDWKYPKGSWTKGVMALSEAEGGWAGSEEGGRLERDNLLYLL